MATYTVGSGSLRLKVTDPFRDIAIRAVREMAPNTLRILESYVDKLVADAKARWPVGRARKGKLDGEGRTPSRELLEAEIVIETNGTVRGRVTNSAAYAYMIKTSQGGVNGSPWQKLVNKPFKIATPALVAALKAETEATLKG